MLETIATPSGMVRISPEIQDALIAKKPVVALESTIIAHGMPYPINIETALSCESLVREQGAIPATIAVINGVISIGLHADEIEMIGQKNSLTPVLKLSRRDLPFAIAKKITGATTVSATMICAHKAGIAIFATGGIGGVHRGGELSLDISADLNELARFDIAVICAGVKAILDIGRTLEVLETLGIPIIGYQTDIFPAFYCRKSPYATDCSAHTPEEIAKIIHTKWYLGISGGVVVANPPKEEHSMAEKQMEVLVTQAIARAESLNIRGKDITPFLLAQIADRTEGESLSINVALIKSNARLAAQVARSLCNLLNKTNE